MGSQNPRQVFCTGLLTGGFIGLGIGYYVYQKYHSCEFTKSFTEVAAKQQGPIDGLIDHILKPILILKDNIYVKKLKYSSVAFNYNQWNQYIYNNEKFYENKGFKRSDIEYYQTINYHLIDLNSKFLTRLLFKKTGIPLPSPYYNKITPIEHEYENILEKLIERELINQK
jgi:hypothetical protein